MDKALTQQQAEDLLHDCLEEGELIAGRHFREELAKRALTLAQARPVLRYGRTYNPPEQGLENWGVEVSRGGTRAGRQVAGNCLLLQEGQACVLTVITV